MDEQKQPQFRVTPRDMFMFKKLLECRVMSTHQIEACFYIPSAHTRCLTRLKLLYEAGFIGRFEQPCLLSEGRRPSIGVTFLRRWTGSP